MDTFSAFLRAEASRGKEQMVFDWVKAAHLIKERKPELASAGLRGDWDYTGGSIYNYGSIVRPEDTYCFLSSTWATPELDLDGEIIPCYKMQSEVPNWNSGTYWPKEALDILNSKGN